MACVDTSIDYQLALSLNMYRCCTTDEWDECSKPCGSSSWEGSTATCSASCAAALPSSAMAYPGIALPDKICWADWVDDTSTQACLSPRSDLSECDEPAENELADNEPVEHELASEPKHRRQSWADLADSSSDDELVSCDTAQVAELSVVEAKQEQSRPRTKSWADVVDSEEEEFGLKLRTVREDEVDDSSPTACAAAAPADDLGDRPAAARSSRASRRTRAARAAAAAVQAGEEEPKEETISASVPVKHDGAEQRPAPRSCSADKENSDRGHNAANTKGSGKAAGKGSNQSATKGTGKGAATKGAGKGKGEVSASTSKGAGKGDRKGAGKGKSTSKGDKGGGKGFNEKYQCQMIVGIEEDSKFRVVRRMIGSGGENMKNINQQSQAKLRLRGRGSKFLEGDEQQESTDDLMLCISSQDKAGYDYAKAMASELIEGIQQSYRAFCHKAGKECPDLQLQIHEGYRSGSR